MIKIERFGQKKSNISAKLLFFLPQIKMIKRILNLCKSFNLWQIYLELIVFLNDKKR